MPSPKRSRAQRFSWAVARGSSRKITLLLAISLSAACTPQTPVHRATDSPPASVTPSSLASTPSTRPTGTAAQIPLPTYARLSAPSGGVVWIVVGGLRLFRSVDRAATWEERQLPSPGLDPEIAFVSEREGWLFSAGPAATQCQVQTVTLWHTRDGGSTWESVPPTGVANARCKNGVAFADSKSGFINAWDTNDPPILYRTTDSGGLWTPSRSLPDPPGFTTRGAGATVRPGRVRAFGSTLLLEATGGGQPSRWVYRSLDGGDTWAFVANGPDPNNPVVFVTPTRWLQLVAAGQSQETVDSGATWHAYGSDYAQAAPTAPDIIFGDPLVGYATVRGELRRTLDGGARWTILKTPGT